MDLSRLMKEFKIKEDELFEPPYYELLCMYISMIKENDEESEEIIEPENIIGYLPCDEYIDSAHLFEQLYFDYSNSLIDQQELKNRFSALFDAIKSIKFRLKIEWHMYCSWKEPNIISEEALMIEFNKSNNNGETYQEINNLLKKFSFEAMHEYSLAQCKESFLHLLDNTKGFISRKTIDENVKYKHLVYKFLKPEYVLDLKGMYLDTREFNLSQETKEYMFEDLEYELSNDDVIHIDDIFDSFKDTYSEEFNTYRIFTSYALFSILEYIFKDKFEFKRPYVTHKGKQIYSKNEMLEKYLKDNSKINIDDLANYIRKLKLSNASFFSIIGSLGNELCFENENSIVHWNNIEISDNQIEVIEDLIYEEVLREHTMAVVDLQCALYFPELNLDWDEWFIYSLIRRYSKRLTVLPSSRQFKYATPVITIEDEIDDFELNYIDEYKNNKKIYKPKDFELDEIELENIEELLQMEV